MTDFTKSFTDKSIMPTTGLVKKVLGNNHPVWLSILKHINDKYGNTNAEWKYYGAKSGWILKTILKKRNLFFFDASEKVFRITFVFGDKAVKEISESNLPNELITELLNAKKYVEGRVISIIVKTKKDAANVCRLIDFKVAN